MSDTRVTLSISALLSDPTRAASYERLRAALSTSVFDAVLVESEPAPNHMWSERMWERAAAVEAEWHVFLQDDTLPCERFRERFDSFVSWRDYEIVGLHVVHPAAAALRREGYDGFTTTDALVGVGYAMTGAVLRDFLNWRSSLDHETVKSITEDTLVGLFAAASGRKIYHPIPALVDHDTTLKSTYGNDHHAHRASACFSPTWPEKVAAVAIMQRSQSERVPHLGCFYGNDTVQRLHAIGAHAAAMLAEGDTGARELRRLSYAQRLRETSEAPQASLFVATPHMGHVHPEYAASIWRLINLASIDISGTSLEIQDVQMWNADIVRTRNRFARHFLTRTDATHLLFVDSDVFFDPATVLRMLAAGRPFVAAPYPRRDSINLARVAAHPAEVPEAAAYRYSVRPLATFDPKGAGFAPDVTGCALVEGMPLGFALIERALLQELSDIVPTYEDEITGRTPNLFGLLTTTEGHLLSEDYSFCRRVREMGQDVAMYLGPGSPVGHAGQHLYVGTIESFGLKRMVTK